MKVISISTDRNIFRDGSAVRSRNIEYGKLARELHIIVFITRKHEARNPKFEIGQKLQIAENVWIYPTNSASKLLYVRDAVRIGKEIIKERNFDLKDSLVTVQDPFECGLAGLFLKKTGKVNLHIQIHTDFLSPYFGRKKILNIFRVAIAKRVLPKADAVRVVSKRILDSLKLKAKKAKVKILPIWVDKRKFETAEVKFSLREKYPEFDTIVLMMCRLEPEKAVKTAIEAMKKVIESHPKTGLTIVGSGSELPNLRLLTYNLGLDKYIRFEDWTDDPLSYYKTADIFLSTSLYEGYGMSMVEAALAGLPIIATDSGIAGDVFSDGQSALICGVGDDDCISRKIIELAEDKEKRQVLGSAARNSALSHLMSKEEYLKRFEESWKHSLGS